MNDYWREVNGKWYYYNNDGTMKKNEWFKQSNGQTFYFGSDGVKYTGIHTIGSYICKFDEGGVLYSKTTDKKVEDIISKDEQIKKYIDLLTKIGINVSKEIKNTGQVKLIQLTKPPVTIGAVFSIQNSVEIVSSGNTTINIADGKFDGLSAETDYLEAAFGVEGLDELALNLCDGKINIAITSDFDLTITMNKEFTFADEKLSYTLSLVINLYLLPNNRPDDGGMPNINTETWKELLTNLKNNMYNTVTDNQRTHQLYALYAVLVGTGAIIAAPVIVPIILSGTSLIIMNQYTDKFVLS